MPVTGHGSAAELNPGRIGRSWKVSRPNGSPINHVQEILKTASHFHP